MVRRKRKKAKQAEVVDGVAVAMTKDQAERLEEMQRLASERGGACLSMTYLNAKARLRFRCAFWHEWEAAPTSIKHMKTWCPFCAQAEGGKRLTADRVRRGPGVQVTVFDVLNDKEKKL